MNEMMRDSCRDEGVLNCCRWALNVNNFLR